MSINGYINTGLNQSLSGIVSITDGSGVTIENGRIESSSMFVDVMTSNNLTVNNQTITGNLNFGSQTINNGQNIVTLNDTQTLTNKTLTNPTISQITNGGILTLPTGNGTLVIGSDLTSYAPLYSPIFSGIPQCPTPSLGTNTDQIASTAFVLSNSVSLSSSNTFTAPQTYLKTSSTPNNTAYNIIGRHDHTGTLIGEKGTGIRLLGMRDNTGGGSL